MPASPPAHTSRSRNQFSKTPLKLRPESTRQSRGRSYLSCTRTEEWEKINNDDASTKSIIPPVAPSSPTLSWRDQFVFQFALPLLFHYDRCFMRHLSLFFLDNPDLPYVAIAVPFHHLYMHQGPLARFEF